MTKNDTSWADVVLAMVKVSRLTHSLGVASCFGHMADDVGDPAYYPQGLAGAVEMKAGLVRVKERHVRDHLPSEPVARRTWSGRGFVVVDNDGTTVAGPFGTHRGAAWVRTHRGLSGCRIEAVMEDRQSWISRSIQAVDSQLAIESAWRDANDILDDYCGVEDRYNQRGNRWFDERSQMDRRETAVAAILRQSK